MCLRINRSRKPILAFIGGRPCAAVYMVVPWIYRNLRQWSAAHWGSHIGWPRIQLFAGSIA